MSGNLALKDQAAIQEAKELASNEKRIFKNLLEKSPEQNTVAELLELLLLQNLLNFLHDSYNDEYSYGYRLGIHAVKSLSNLHSNLLPLQSFLVREKEKFSSESHINLDKESLSLSYSSSIIEEILLLISELISCQSFQYSHIIEGKVFLAKQQASTIPNPHDIPKNFPCLINKNSKEAYKNYADFLHFYGGNWTVGIKILSQIQSKLDDLNKICPFIRFSITQGLLAEMQLDTITGLAPDILTNLIGLDLQDVISSHKYYLIDFIKGGITDTATLASLAQKLKHLIEILTHPLKDVKQLAIIMEQTIKIMLTMRSLQAGGHLTNEQNNLLQKMEKFFEETLDKQSLQVKEMVAVSYKIVGSALEKHLESDKSQEASRTETSSVSRARF